MTQFHEFLNDQIFPIMVGISFLAIYFTIEAHPTDKDT